MKLNYLPRFGFQLSAVWPALGCAMALSLHAAQPADPYEGLAKFQFGQSREPLALIEEQIRQTTPADYKAIEAKLLAVLKAPDTTKDAKRFICRWLGVAGSAECVPLVADLLTDPDLSHPARMALEPLPTPAAGAALRAALPKVQGKLLVGVIGSIGIRRDAQAVDALSRLAQDNDPLVAGTALAALGQIGTEEAARALDAAKVPENLARVLARARIVAASRLAAVGQKALAAAIFRSLMPAQQPPATRIAALKGLIGALPVNEAAQLITDMVQGEDAPMRAATIAAYMASTDKELKDKVAAELPAMKPAGQLILLGVLADLPDVAARPSVLRVLKETSDENVRVAALECLARHGEAADVPLLVGLANAPAAPVASAAKKTLLRLGKPGVDEALAGMIESPSASERAVVMATLANRRVESALPVLVKLLGGRDEAMAVEAAKALGVMGKIEQLRELAKVAGATDKDTLRTAAGEAARTICQRLSDKAASAAVLLAVLEQTTGATGRAALLQLFVYTGGEPALAVVVKAMQDNNAEVKTAATRALVGWPEAAAGQPLLEFARTTAEASQAIVALRDGCLRLAEMEENLMPTRVEILRGVLRVAKRAEEKNRAIALLGQIPSTQALDLLQSSAQDAALRDSATKGAIRLARQLAPVFNRQALAALQQIKSQAATDEIRALAEQAIKAAQNAGQTPEGYAIAWLLSGPYTEEGKDGAALFDVAFAPEKAGATANWRPVTGSKSGLVELDKIIGGNERVAYLRTQIISEQDQGAVLELGSDDGIKVWLNGKVVHANNAVRPCTPGSDKAKVKLQKGKNDLLLKVTQGGGEWAACCRVRDASGKELPDVTMTPNGD